MRTRLINLCERFTAFTQGVSALLLVLATLLVFYQVITRFLLNNPATWTEVLARAAMIWMVFLAAGAAFKQGSMITLDFFRAILPPSVQNILLGVVTLLCILFIAVLIWYGYQMTGRVHKQTVALLGVPMSWLYAAIPVGALCAIPGIILHYLKPASSQNS